MHHRDFNDRTALVVVDVQNDFADPVGSLYVRTGEDAVPFINEQVAAAAASGSFVVYTQDWHPETTPHFETDGGIWPVHCVADNWGAEFYTGLDVVGPSVKKGVGGEDGYSGFTVSDPLSGQQTPTKLESLLRERAIQRVVIVGVLETNPGLALFICRYRGNRQTIHDHRIERAWDEAFGVGLELLMAGCLHFHFCHPCCVAAGHVQEGDLLFIRSVAFCVTYDGESSLECRVEVRAVNSRRFEQFSKR